MGHARALLALDDETIQRVARDQVLKAQLNVRSTEALVKRLKGEIGQPKKKAPAADIHLADLENQLRRRFQAKVKLKTGSRGGAIEIPFASQDELSRLIELMLT
jgi:ParB family chromosome partitioning protein